MPQTKETGGVAEHYSHYMLNLSGCYIYNQDILPRSALRVNIFTILSYTTTALIHDDLKQQKECWLSQDKILKCDKMNMDMSQRIIFHLIRWVKTHLHIPFMPSIIGLNRQ